MLSSFEQRQLRAIERSLETNDPVWAERIRNTDHVSSAELGLRNLSAVAMAGAVLAVVGLVVSPLVVALGVAVTVLGLSMRLVLDWVSRADDVDQSLSDRDGS